MSTIPTDDYADFLADQALYQYELNGGCAAELRFPSSPRGMRQDDRGRGGLDRGWLVDGTEDEPQPRMRPEVQT